MAFMHHNAIRNFYSWEERDWIIFKTQDIFYPTKFEIQCGGTSQDVKQMQIYFGSAEINKWHLLSTSDIVCHQSATTQTFQFDDNQLRHFKHFKIELIENHLRDVMRERKTTSCRYVIRKLQLYGKKL